MPKSPLDHPRLRAIERKLDSGQLDEAQHLLGQLGQGEYFRHPITYLVIRLRYLRGQLDDRGVRDRLEGLIAESGEFPEAAAMLDAARTGTLSHAPARRRTSNPPPEVERAFGGRARDSEVPPIPRAGRVPKVVAEPVESASKSAPPIPDLNLGTRPPPGFPPDGVRPATVAPPTPPRQEPHIISAAPPPVEKPALSLFEIAELLDEGRLAEALAAIEASGRRDEPDHALMEARILSRSGRRDPARALLHRLGHAPLLEPEIRAGIARLAIELDEIDLAFEQAKVAAGDDWNQPMVRVSLAWAALRSVRRTADPDAIAMARRALAELGESGPHGALILALLACIEAHAGSAERARTQAERSLEIEPSADALAALTMACLRLGLGSDAGRAGIRLRQLSPSEANVLEESVERFGAELFELGPGERGSFARPRGEPALRDETERELWGPLELAIVEGRRDEAWSIFAQLAEDTFAQVSRNARLEPPALAAVAASFLTVAPISRDFAPFDSTLFSIARVDAALGLIAGGLRNDRHETHALTALVGAYVGDALRQALGLRWHGSPAIDEDVVVESPLGRWRPIELVRNRLALGKPIEPERAFELARKRSGAFTPHLPPIAPPCPWDPALWPPPSMLSAIARALPRSVISTYLGESGNGALDGTELSVRALDAYLDLLAPRGVSLSPPSGWARRATPLLGAYFGEILRDTQSGEWSTADELELRADSYLLLTPRGTLMPIAYVWGRLSGNAPSLVERLARVTGHSV